jgi:hypothetical protein
MADIPPSAPGNTDLVEWYAIGFALSNNSLFLQLPGVDPNDPSVKDLLASMQNQSEVSLLLLKNTIGFDKTFIENRWHG